MNHDYSHCLDFKENCPKKCFRAELVRDLRSREDMVGVPVSWMHFKGSDECPKVKMKNMRLIDANAIEYEQIMEPMGNGMYSHANHVYEGDIDAMPTVDAIPVEWMENRECKPDEAYAIRKMLNEWAERKEE